MSVPVLRHGISHATILVAEQLLERDALTHGVHTDASAHGRCDVFGVLKGLSRVQHELFHPFIQVFWDIRAIEQHVNTVSVFKFRRE